VDGEWRSPELSSPNATDLRPPVGVALTDAPATLRAMTQARNTVAGCVRLISGRRVAQS